MLSKLRAWHLSVMLVVALVVGLVFGHNSCAITPEEKAEKAASVQKREAWIEQCAQKDVEHTSQICQKRNYNDYCLEWQDKKELYTYDQRYTRCADTWDDTH